MNSGTVRKILPATAVICLLSMSAGQSAFSARTPEIPPAVHMQNGMQQIADEFKATGHQFTRALLDFSVFVVQSTKQRSNEGLSAIANWLQREQARQAARTPT
jgi:hypothetical protein